MIAPCVFSPQAPSSPSPPTPVRKFPRAPHARQIHPRRRDAERPRAVAHVLTSSFGGAVGRGILHEARLILGATEQIAALPDEVEPRAVLKKNVKIFPEVDRHHKGDPLVGLRPTIDGALRQKGGQRSLAQIRAEFLTFGDETDLASRFASSLDDGGVEALRPALAEGASQGATPRVPRAVALASSTPYAADQAPVRVFASAFAAKRLETTSVARTNEKRDYLALIPPEKMDSEKLCLAQAIYFEARSEPEAGRAAVAQVILNRMTSGHYPSSICGVVFQNQQNYHACQFSFTCEGRALRVRDAEAWAQATRVADDVLGGKTGSPMSAPPPITTLIMSVRAGRGH